MTGGEHNQTRQDRTPLDRNTTGPEHDTTGHDRKGHNANMTGSEHNPTRQDRTDTTRQEHDRAGTRYDRIGQDTTRT